MSRLMASLASKRVGFQFGFGFIPTPYLLAACLVLSSALSGLVAWVVL